MNYPEGPLAMKAIVLNAMATDGAALPAAAREKIAQLLAESSAVGLIVTAMEALYASREGLSPVWLTVGAQAANVIEENGFYNKAARAEALHQIFRRCLGEPKIPAAYKDPQNDPEVDAAFAPPAPEPAPAGGSTPAPEPAQ